MKSVRFLCVFALSLFIVGMPAFAETTMTSMLCGGYSVFSGSVGKMLAIFAIVALGVGLFMGKITWGLVFAVALGIGAIFGAPKIVSVITGGSNPCSGVSTDTQV